MRTIASRRVRAGFLGMLLALLGARQASATSLLVENFDNIATLGASGWITTNNSAPAGTTSWFQGNPGVFGAHNGSPDSYIAANFEAAGFGGNISDWLITPVMPLNDDDVLTFWTRTEAGSAFPDRLEVRMSTSGGSAVGATDSSVGDFSSLLLTINPAVAPGGYPENWALFSVTIGGLGSLTNARLAFRYFVPDTSVNGDYIGIDAVTVDAPVPEPTTLVLLGTTIVAAARARRRSRRT